MSTDESAFVPSDGANLHAGSHQRPLFQTLSILANDMLPVTTRTIGGAEMAGHEQRDWRELCAAVTNEPDSKKLDSMVQELIRALDEGERDWRRRINSFSDNWQAA